MHKHFLRFVKGKHSEKGQKSNAHAFIHAHASNPISWLALSRVEGVTCPESYFILLAWISRHLSLPNEVSRPKTLITGRKHSHSAVWWRWWCRPRRVRCCCSCIWLIFNVILPILMLSYLIYFKCILFFCLGWIFV